MIGIFNPLIDRDILISLEGIDISGGWVSFVSILIRFVLTVGAALTLIAVTGYFQNPEYRPYAHPIQV
jgi:cobalt/nickel transport system permease protein